MNSPSDLVLVGGGEHAAVVLDAARLSARVVVGYVDDSPTAMMARSGLPWLGDDARVLGQADATAHSYVIAFGALGRVVTRQAAVARYASHEVRFATIIHPRAIVAASAQLGAGAVVLAGAVVNPHAKVGAHAIVNTGAIVEHDVEVSDFAHIAPGAVIGGGARIGVGTTIGLGASVRDHCVVGSETIVGMGAVVVRSVPAGVIVAGVPARPLKRQT